MKRFLKAILVWLYSEVRPEKGSKAVFYHDIGTTYTPMGTDLKIFKQHLKILEEEKCEGRNHLVCFDDGFRGVWDHRELLLHGTKIFIAPRLVGRLGYLTWDEIRTLDRKYGIDFQCHTWSHQTLAGPMIDESPVEERTESWYERELVASKLKIEEELGKAIDELCFPAGLLSDQLVSRCKQAGYQKVFASYPGNITNEYVQPRCLCQDLSSFAFRAALNGGLNLFRSRYRKRHWVG